MTGRVFWEYGTPAAGVTLQAYRRGFGGVEARLGDAVTTDRNGRYRIDFEVDGGPLNLELRALEPRRSDNRPVVEVPLTTTVFDVAPDAKLNVVAPTSVRPLATEYERLRADLEPHLHGNSLGTARETAEQPDLTLLQESTGWDARLVALAASAVQATTPIGDDATSRRLLDGVTDKAAYAMLRTGLPADPVGLAGVSETAVRRALGTAAESALVTLSRTEIQEAVTAFVTFARRARLDAVAPGARSSQREMLAVAGLSSDDAARFDEIYHDNEHRGGDTERLWRRAKAARLPVPALQRTGKLGYLTLNNATLTAHLRDALGDDLGAALASAHLHRPEAWVELLTTVARGDGDALAALVPPAFAADTVERGVERYAHELARKVRVGYPTNVVADMVRTNAVSLPGTPSPARKHVATFLDRAAAAGFALGRSRVSAMHEKKELLAGVPEKLRPAVVDAVKTLQRTYQITPSNGAMSVLLDLGLRSAHDVTAMSPARFRRQYEARRASTGEADLVYAKAQQITSASLAVVTAAAQLDVTPPVFALAGSQEDRDATRADLVQTFPTLEELFGSLDYCDCDHCRSVLSPAAYLVDLLHFLDPAAEQWQAVLDEWHQEHDDAPYPFADDQAWQDHQEQWALDHPDRPVPPDPEVSPFTVLARRRPDLANLPLTCENTNTALPYVDVVNEALEFFVAHGKLGADAAQDTGDALTADLLAEPQYLIPEAYHRLRRATYPLGLPFDLWLETARRLLDHFDTPRWQVLDAFRRTDALYPADRTRYGQAVVAIERLGLSGAEYALLTDPDPESGWHEHYGYPTAAQAQDELSTAATLAGRLGLSYRELLDVMATGFVNPRLARIPALPKLGIGISDVLRYRDAPGHAPFSAAERADFEALLEPVGGPDALDAELDDLAPILVLADPVGSGAFETTTVQYADGRPADPIAFLTLNYLVRLWRRLGWSLADTDRALQVLLPTDPDPRTDATLGSAMASALLGLSRLTALHDHLRGDRRELLELWSDLTAARYEKLFLVPGTPAIDPLFDDPFGHYLRNSSEPLGEHVETVRAALRLSAEDVDAILADAGTTLEAAFLDMATVSLLHRYGVLARRLRMPVAELIVLRQLAGLDPFAPPPNRPVTAPEDDHAQTTVAFVETVLAVRDAGVPVAELDYLLRHRYDPAGPYLIAAEPPLPLIRALDAEITRIRTEHADPPDPTLITDEQLRQEMALVLPVEVVEWFFGMWTGTISLEVTEPDVAEDAALDPAAVADAPEVTVTYEAGVQHLVYRGALTSRDARRLVDRYGRTLDTDTDVLRSARELYARLLTQVVDTQKEFFTLSLVGPTGFLRRADYDEFFTGRAPTGDDRQRLAGALLPFVRDRLIDEAVLATVGAEFPDAVDLVTALVTEPALMEEVALLPAYRAAADRGLTEVTDIRSTSVDTHVEVTTADTYTFAVTCATAGTVVDLRFDHLTDALVLATTAADGETRSAPVDLSPGSIYHLRLDASATGGGAVTLEVQGPNLPLGVVDRLTCRPGASVERVRQAHVLLDKSLRLAAAGELTEPELRHVLTHPRDFDDVSLAALPVSETDHPAGATVLFRRLLRLLDLAALRREMGAAPGELTDLFAHARQTYLAGTAPDDASATLLADLHERLAVLTRRDTETVADAVARLGLTATARASGDGVNAVVRGLVNEIGLRRLWTVLSLARRIGITPGALAASATAPPTEASARSLRDAVRAGYDVATWRRVAQPIFDGLRRRRRDALVAWIQHAEGFDRLEQLYEFFLLDPGTEPVVQTSRMRLAISAVQLFIQRCLLGLEPAVHPSAINADHWGWMKRYRVWEANRKIFLWPENWLEPEFRDDKSHLFDALESGLLSGDVTDDLAEEAFFAYLRSLETIARLDIRTLYVEEKPEDPGSDVLHVVGRTFGAPNQYFYRTYQWGAWTPWVPVPADIEGDHLVVAVWRQRPHLLWVTFVERAVAASETEIPLGATSVTVSAVPRIIDVHLHWAEYYQGEWTDPASSALGDVMTTTGVDPAWSPDWERVHVTHDGDALLVHLNVAYWNAAGRTGIDKSFRLRSRSSPPAVDTAVDPPDVPYWTTLFDHGVERGRLPLSVLYVDRVTVTDENLAIAQVLGDGDDYELRVADHPLTTTDPDIASLVSPFFYQDDQHTFHVEPALTEKSVAEWDGWVTGSVTAHQVFDRNDYWSRIELVGQVSTTGADALEPIAPTATYQVQPRSDWVTAAGTTITYDGVQVVGHTTEGTRS